MKKRLVLSLSSILLVSLLFSPHTFSQETPGTVVRVAPRPLLPDNDSHLKVDIVIENGQAVTGYQVMLQYDSDYIEYVGIDHGNYLPDDLPDDAFFGDAQVRDTDPNDSLKAILFAATAFPNQSEGDGVLATLTFETKIDKPSDLTLLDVTLLSHGVDDNQVAVSSPQLENSRTHVVASPDLVIESFGASLQKNYITPIHLKREITLKPNDVFYLYVSFKNVGAETSDRTRAVYSQSDGKTLSKAKGRFVSLSGNKGVARMLHRVAPNTPGTYAYHVCVEPVTGESKTGNNCSDTVEITVDHGDTPTGATLLPLNSSSTSDLWSGSLSGEMQTLSDVDYFKVQIPENGKLTLWTTGDLDTVGTLETNTGKLLITDDNSGGNNSNFEIHHDVIKQTYYVKVTGSNNSIGNYTIHARFTPPSNTIHLDDYWLWMIVPTESGKGGETSIHIDSLCEASQGTVIETLVASHGAKEDDRVGNYKWTSEKISADGNINQTLTNIGWANQNEDVNDHSAYALLQISVPFPLTVPMHVGGDDAVKVWLNGEIVYLHEKNRPSSGYQDTFDVDLNRGSNLLMVKVSQRSGAWKMFVGFDVPSAETAEDIDIFLPTTFTPAHRPMVRVIYYYPADQKPRRGFDRGLSNYVCTKISVDNLHREMRDTQKFIAEEMAKQGYTYADGSGKTFLLEVDDQENNNMIVHQIQADWMEDADLSNIGKNNGVDDLFRRVWADDIMDQWKKNNMDPDDPDMSKHIYFAVIQMTLHHLDAGIWGGTAGAAIRFSEKPFLNGKTGRFGYGKTLMPLGGCLNQAYNQAIIAHELGHAFGLAHTFGLPDDLELPHGKEDRKEIMAYGDQETLSESTAHWLDAHPAFNVVCSVQNDNTSIIDIVEPSYSLPAGFVYPTGAQNFLLKVKVTDMDKIHQIQLNVLWKRGGLELYGYKNLDIPDAAVEEVFDLTKLMANLAELTISFQTIDTLGNMWTSPDVTLVNPNFVSPAPVSLARLQPTETALLANYPNPFNPETWIPYQLAKPADVSLTIYDIQGRVVRDLDLGHQRIGVYESRARAAYWDGRNAVGEPVASGVYFYTLTAGNFTATRKMLIRK